MGWRVGRIRLYFSGFCTAENLLRCYQKIDIIIFTAFGRIHKKYIAYFTAVRFNFSILL